MPWRLTAFSSSRWRSSTRRITRPAVSLVVQCVWASLLTLTGTYNDLLDYVIFAVLLFYMLTIAGVFVLRRRLPDAAAALPRVGLSGTARPVHRSGRDDRSSAAALQADLHLARTDHRAARGAGVLRVEDEARGVTCGIQAKRLNHESDDDEALEPHHGGVGGRRAHAEAHAGTGEPGGSGHRRHHRRGAVLADRASRRRRTPGRPSRCPSCWRPSAARLRGSATASSRR